MKQIFIKIRHAMLRVIVATSIFMAGSLSVARAGQAPPLDPPNQLGLPEIPLFTGPIAGRGPMIVVESLIFITSFVAVFFVVIGAIQYASSNGDSKKIDGAKNTIRGAVIGLAIALFARLIVGFVLENAPK